MDNNHLVPSSGCKSYTNKIEDIESILDIVKPDFFMKNWPLEDIEPGQEEQ